MRENRIPEVAVRFVIRLYEETRMIWDNVLSEM